MLKRFCLHPWLSSEKNEFRYSKSKFHVSVNSTYNFAQRDSDMKNHNLSGKYSVRKNYISKRANSTFERMQEQIGKVYFLSISVNNGFRVFPCFYWYCPSCQSYYKWLKKKLQKEIQNLLWYIFIYSSLYYIYIYIYILIIIAIKLVIILIFNNCLHLLLFCYP